MRYPSGPETFVGRGLWERVKHISRQQLFLSSQKFYPEKCVPPQIFQINFVAPHVFGFMLSENRVNQRGKVFVDKDIVVRLVITEARLFFWLRTRKF